MELSYNIHNLLKIKVISYSSSLDDLDREFAYFKHADLDDPDITLNIGNFKPCITNCYVVDYKYYVKDNYIYYEDSEGKVKWKIEVSGFEDGKTTINLFNSVKGAQRILNPNFLAKDLLLRFIEYKLEKVRHYLIHSAGVSRNREAYLLVGRGNSLKTTLTIDLIRRGKFNFLGDDHVIINYSGDILSFPENLHILEYILENLETENSWSLADKIKFAYNIFVRKRKVVKHDLMEIDESPKLKAILLILRKKSRDVYIRELSREETVRRIVANNLMDDFISPQKLNVSNGLYLKCILAYSYVFPRSKIARFHESFKKGLENILKSVQTYEVEMPEKYQFDTFKKIESFLNTL